MYVNKNIWAVCLTPPLPRTHSKRPTTTTGWYSKKIPMSCLSDDTAAESQNVGK
jgi:hypothetical protein